MNTLFKLNLLFISLFAFSNGFAQNTEDVEQYIDRYKQLAMEEQVRSGVPAAITLAQGIHESAAGKSELATEANNHFGIKCKTTWKGMTYLHDDDARQECFRKYSNALESYKDHSDFLRNNNRYAFLFDLEVTDFQGWASGLKRAGYATNPAYVKRLTDVIEKYNLQQYTFEANNSKFSPVGEKVPEEDRKLPPKPAATAQKDTKQVEEIYVPEITYYKGLKGFWAKKGDMLLQKASEQNIRYSRLLQINELTDTPLENDQFIFIEKKRKVGTSDFHTVEANETMLSIAQKEAMNSENLYEFNLMKPGQEPEVGEKLYLIYKSAVAPKLKTKFLETINSSNDIAKEALVEKKQVLTIQEKEKTMLQPKVAKAKEAVETIIQEVDEVKKSDSKEIVTNDIEVPVLSDEELKKIEVLKQEIQTQELQKVEEAKIIPAKTVEEKKVEVIDETSPIIDLEKAKRIEELLSKEKRVEKDVVTKEITIVEQPTVSMVKEIIQQEPPKEIKTAPLPQKELRVAPKRTYNEKNVDEDTKSLKKKFDDAVYRPLPERKVIEKTTTGITRDTAKTKVAAKETQKNTTTTATTKAVKKAKAAEDNNSVKKTATGITRDTSKVKVQNKKIATTKTKTEIEKKKEVAKKDTKKDEVKKDNKKKTEPTTKGKNTKDDKKKDAVKNDTKKKTESKTKENNKTPKKK